MLYTRFSSLCDIMYGHVFPVLGEQPLDLLLRRYFMCGLLSIFHVSSMSSFDNCDGIRTQLLAINLSK